MKWTEEIIRQELKRLDEITGLHGNDLIVEFGNARYTLGCFIAYEGKPIKFRFSRRYLDSEDFSTHEAYDLIRHEYAHYMNLELNGDDSGDGAHGEMWKACCRRIGASPTRCYNPHMNEIYLRKEHEAAEASQKLSIDLTWMQVGVKLRHPTLGLGEILAIEGSASNTRLKMAFQSGEVKSISAKWMADICKHSPQSLVVPL